MTWELKCGPPLPKVTDANEAEIKAHWDAYCAEWAGVIRGGGITWWEVARTFADMARKEEFLAAALVLLAAKGSL